MYTKVNRLSSSNVIFYAIIILLSVILGLASVMLNAIWSFMIIAVLIFVFTILVNYRIGIWLLFLLLPLASTNFVPHQILGIKGFNPINILILMTVFSVYLMRNSRTDNLVLLELPKQLKIYLMLLILGGFAGCFFASSSLPVLNFEGSYDDVSVFRYISDYLFKPFLILIIAYLGGIYVINENSVHKLLWAMLFCYLIFFVTILVVALETGVNLKMLASTKARSFLSWTGMHANELGLFFNMGLALFTYTFLSAETRFQRIMFAVGAAICGAMALFTFSRGAFLGTAVVGAYYVLTRRQLHALLLGVIVIASIIVILPDAFFQRLTEGFSGGGERDAVSAGRMDFIWKPLFTEFLKSPVWGHGLSSTLWSEPLLTGQMLRVGHPHSAYLGVLLDFGILGAFVVVYFFLSMWNVFRLLMNSHPQILWRGYFEGASVCILILLVQGATDDRFVPTYPQIYLWFAYGLGIASVKRYINVTTEDVVIHKKSRPMVYRPRKLKSYRLGT